MKPKKYDFNSYINILILSIIIMIIISLFQEDNIFGMSASLHMVLNYKFMSEKM